jgi:uncharacterized protein (DUF433 family)
MLNIQQLESEISVLPVKKKQALFNYISIELNYGTLGIEKKKGVCGGSAFIVRTRIPVWTLVSYKNLGLSNFKLLDVYPSLTVYDLNNAWNYYRTNKKEIDLDILENKMD